MYGIFIIALLVLYVECFNAHNSYQCLSISYTGQSVSTNHAYGNDQLRKLIFFLLLLLKFIFYVSAHKLNFIHQLYFQCVCGWKQKCNNDLNYQRYYAEHKSNFEGRIRKKKKCERKFYANKKRPIFYHHRWQ